MRPSFVVCSLLGLVVVATLTPGLQAQGVGDLLGGLTKEGLIKAVTEQLVGLWQTGELEFLDHYCNFQVKPKIKKWQLYFVGSMWCPGWTPIRGTAETRSRSGVVNKAVRDFVDKAFNEGLITEAEAAKWLKQ